MGEIANYQVVQLISSATGFFLTIIGAIARLTELISREQFINISFVALILLIAIPFFIEYVARQDEDETNEIESNQQKTSQGKNWRDDYPQAA